MEDSNDKSYDIPSFEEWIFTHRLKLRALQRAPAPEPGVDSAGVNKQEELAEFVARFIFRAWLTDAAEIPLLFYHGVRDNIPEDLKDEKFLWVHLEELYIKLAGERYRLAPESIEYGRVFLSQCVEDIETAMKREELLKRTKLALRRILLIKEYEAKENMSLNQTNAIENNPATVTDNNNAATTSNVTGTATTSAPESVSLPAGHATAMADFTERTAPSAEFAAVTEAVENFGKAETYDEFCAGTSDAWAEDTMYHAKTLAFVRGAISTPGLKREVTPEDMEAVWKVAGPDFGDPRPMTFKYDTELKRAMKAKDVVTALSCLVEVFFDGANEVIGYMTANIWYALAFQSLAINRTGAVAPPSFWIDSMHRCDSRQVASLILHLACPKGRLGDLHKFCVHWAFTAEPSGSLEKILDKAVKLAKNNNKSTVIGAQFIDLALDRETKVSFGHWLVLGVSREGVRLWQASIAGDYSLETQADHGPPLWMEAEDALKFGRDFDSMAVDKGTWSKKMLRTYKECFGVELQKLQEGGRKLSLAYEAFARFIVFEDVKRADLTKLAWR